MLKNILATLLLSVALVTSAYSQGRTVTALPDVTVAGTAILVRAANSAREALNCTNNHATAHLRWGDSTVATTSGQRIRATLPIEIKSKAAIYMISEDGGTSITVSCTEETR